MVTDSLMVTDFVCDKEYVRITMICKVMPQKIWCAEDRLRNKLMRLCSSNGFYFIV